MAQTLTTTDVATEPMTTQSVANESAVNEQVVATSPSATQQQVTFSPSVDDTVMGEVGSQGYHQGGDTAQVIAVNPHQSPYPNEGVSGLATIPMGHGLALAGILFAIGMAGVMARRNFLFMLMSLEIMMNAAALAFIVGGSRWINPDGQVMFIFILTLAAAEAAIGLAILLQFYHKRGHLDVDSANEMKG